MTTTDPPKRVRGFAYYEPEDDCDWANYPVQPIVGQRKRLSFDWVWFLIVLAFFSVANWFAMWVIVSSSMKVSD